MNALDANKYIGRANNQKQVLSTNYSTDDIVEAILYADERSAKHTRRIAPKLQGKSLLDTARNIWLFVKKNVRYKADSTDRQWVKSPAKMWADRVGDCKSMSVFTGSVLKNLGIPFAYRFTSYDGTQKVTHVYVVVPNGKDEIIIDTVHTHFNAQVPYTYKKDFLRNAARISGFSKYML